MRYFRWGFWIILLSVIFAFLHYTLPQRDIVRVVGTENRRIDIGQNAIFWSSSETGMANSTSRDVYFINGAFPSGKVITYRNENTGWGWPPYFKIGSDNLQTQAKDLTSTKDAPIWVAVTHYGWKNELFTIFPNAVGLKRVDSPDVTLIPWVNIIILGALLAVLVMIRRMWLQFRERMIDPTIDRIDARVDETRAEARGFWVRTKNWWNKK